MQRIVQSSGLYNFSERSAILSLGIIEAEMFSAWSNNVHAVCPKQLHKQAGRRIDSRAAKL